MAPSPATPVRNSSPSLHISKPVIQASLEQPPPDDAFTSPRPAPHPPTADMFYRKKLKASRSTCYTPSPLHPSPEEWDLPDATQLTHVSSLPIISENGQRITFGSLFATRRAIVIFIRHFWCPLCQDYMSSLKSTVTPEMLRSVTTELVIVGNGSPAMMAKYRQIFGLPFKMYTDPSNAVYRALGMGQDKSAGHMHSPNKPRKRGGYVRHGMMSGIALVVMRAIKVGMPVWEKGGDIAQLGGEFVLGPGQKCSYAHRMQSTKGHAPIRDVLEAAGI
ncbi:AhpC/TSA antioxidant enzyme-domain-containing protein, partial [Panaeolus papilionaceus]